MEDSRSDFQESRWAAKRRFEEQAAVVEPHDPDNHWWHAYGIWGTADQPLQSHENGGNAVFLDGHATWRPTEDSQPRIQLLTTSPWAGVYF